MRLALAPVPTVKEIQEQDLLLRATGHDVGVPAFFGLIIPLCLTGIGGGFAIAAASMSVVSILTLFVLVVGFLGSLYGMLLAIGSPNAPGAHSLPGRLRARRATRVQSRHERGHQRALSTVDAVEGWRPRVGMRMPAGRTDTHDRYRVAASEVGEQIKLVVERWKYQEDTGWQVAAYASAPSPLLLPGDDEDAVLAARSLLDEQAAELEGRSAISAAEAIAIAEAAEAARVERVRLIACINAEPSV